ncbi:MAG: peptidylprolyl isomerase [Lentisphaeria bacterium]
MTRLPHPPLNWAGILLAVLALVVLGAAPGRAEVTGTILINDGAATATSRSVTLTLAATTTDAMRLSRDGVTWSNDDWTYYSSSSPFVFTPGNGPRTVWVQFAADVFNADGSVKPYASWDLSPAVSATIDLQVPAVTLPPPRWTQPAELPRLYYKGGQATVPLTDYASDPAYERVLLTTTKGDIPLRLYEAQAPLAVANFLRYVDAGHYDDTFFHRLVAGFILQGGGYYVDSNTVQEVATYAAVKNEFGASNTRGTVAMAKHSGDPDSATNGWFVNLADNSANLDYQNGGFTVFGEVADLTAVDAIAALPCSDQSKKLGNAFSELPVLKVLSGELQTSDLVYLQSATHQADDLSFTITSTVAGAAATISNGVLTIRADGTVTDNEGTLTLRATGTGGRTADLALPIRITSNRPPVLEKGAATKKAGATEDKPLKIKIAVKDPDKGDTLTWTVPTQGTLGTATLVPATRPSATSATFLYTPNPDATGTDKFTVCVTDSRGFSDTVDVAVTIKPVNDAPAISGLPTAFSVQAGTTGVLNFTLTDVDSPLDAMTLTVKTSNTKRLPLAAIVPGGTGTARTLTLSPPAATIGAAVTVTLTVKDSSRKAVTVKIPVTVTPAAIASDVGNGSYSGASCTSVDISNFIPVISFAPLDPAAPAP